MRFIIGENDQIVVDAWSSEEEKILRQMVYTKFSVSGRQATQSSPQGHAHHMVP